jgi:hypothetical protein
MLSGPLPRAARCCSPMPSYELNATASTGHCTASAPRYACCGRSCLSRARSNYYQLITTPKTSGAITQRLTLAHRPRVMPCHAPAAAPMPPYQMQRPPLVTVLRAPWHSHKTKGAHRAGPQGASLPLHSPLPSSRSNCALRSLHPPTRTAPSAPPARPRLRCNLARSITLLTAVFQPTSGPFPPPTLAHRPRVMPAPALPPATRCQLLPPAAPPRLQLPPSRRVKRATSATGLPRVRPAR